MDSLRGELDLIHSELKHLSQRVAKLENGHCGSSMEISPQALMEQVERQIRENRAARAWQTEFDRRPPSKWAG
jgi:hypothetical protein